MSLRVASVSPQPVFPVALGFRGSIPAAELKINSFDGTLSINPGQEIASFMAVFRSATGLSSGLPSAQTSGVVLLNQLDLFPTLETAAGAAGDRVFSLFQSFGATCCSPPGRAISA